MMRAAWCSGMDGCTSMTDTLDPPHKPQSLMQRLKMVLHGQDGHPLVPSENIAGRALVVVIAIMTFLAALTTGAAQLLASASQDWQGAVATELTIQVRPVQGRNIDQDVARAAAIAGTFKGISKVRPYSKRESEALLEPWLGTGLGLDDLPVPRLIVLQSDAPAHVDIEGLKKALGESLRNASLDDHRVWTARLQSMARSVIGIAIGLVVLVLIATGLAVGFATRGAISGNRNTMEVLHFVGATDAFIAREFQRHFLLLGLQGGFLGGMAALLFFLVAQFFAEQWIGSVGSEQMSVLFGSFILEKSGYAGIFLTALLVALLTALVSRLTVAHTLRSLT